MNILLINPFWETKYPQPPLGLAMLASILEENGHVVKLLDLTALRLSENVISQIINDEKPSIVGITAMTATFNAAIRVARKVKEVDENILIVLGGAHASILPEETLKTNLAIDIIVRGEGERTIIELVDTIDKNTNDFSKILGLTYRTKSGIISNDSRPPISDLDSLPLPAFHLLPKEKYRFHPPFGKKTPSMPIMISRGCPYSCIFCSKSVFGNKYRHNSPNYVVNQIQFLIDKFGVKEIKFYDDVFTLDRKWVLEICTEFNKRNIKIPWTCETRVNLVDEELLRTMHASGCYMIAYGVESGDQNVLNYLGKNTTLDQIINAFNLTHNSGIDTVGYFMLGSPTETTETIKRTIELAKQLNPDFVQFSIATPYPGTKFSTLAAEHGCLPKDWSKYIYADLKSKASFFGNNNLNQNELNVWSKKAYTSFYLRWKYIWKRMKKMRTINDLKTNIDGLRILLNLN